MTTLTVFAPDRPDTPELVTEDPAQIRDLLVRHGIRFERWPTRDLPAQAGDEEILQAYEDEVSSLKAECGFRMADVVSLTPEHPRRAELRQMFLDEHTHSEDEVRFFVRGQGLFYLHPAERVYALLCCRNDLISVPDGTPHWFDMGPEPEFTCIRLFSNPEGWVASHTGDDIAARLPRYEALVEASG